MSLSSLLPWVMARERCPTSLPARPLGLVSSPSPHFHQRDPDTSSDPRGQASFYPVNCIRLLPESDETKKYNRFCVLVSRIIIRRDCFRVTLRVQTIEITFVMHTHMHLVIVFSFPIKSSSKIRLREEIRNVEEEYTGLLRLLESSGLKAVGKPGRRHGELIVLVHSPLAKLNQLARSEQ